MHINTTVLKNAKVTILGSSKNWIAKSRTIDESIIEIMTIKSVKIISLLLWKTLTSPLTFVFKSPCISPFLNYRGIQDKSYQETIRIYEDDKTEELYYEQGWD